MVAAAIGVDLRTLRMGVKHELVVAISYAVFGRIACAAAVDALGFDSVYGVCVALVNEPSWTGGVKGI